MYSLEVKNSVIKDFRKIPKNQQQKIWDHIQHLKIGKLFLDSGPDLRRLMPQVCFSPPPSANILFILCRVTISDFLFLWDTFRFRG